MKITHNAYLTSALSGLLFTSALSVGLYAFSWLAKVLFPLAFEGMTVLVFGGFVYIGVLVLSLLMAIFASHLLLRGYLAKNRVFILLCGPLFTCEAALGIMFTVPELNRLVFIGIVLVVSMASFVLATFLTNIPRSPRIVITLSVFVILGYVTCAQYNAGTRRAQLHGLLNAGYTIYIPSESSAGILAQSLAPSNQRYDGYKDGVTLAMYRKDGTIDINPNLDESKVSGLPSPSCGNKYIRSYQNGLSDKYECEQVSDVNGIKIYSRISKSHYPNGECDYLIKDYFAVAGSTYIQSEGGGNQYCENGVDDNGSDIPDGAQRIEKVKTLLMSLKPAQPEQLKQLTMDR